MNFGFFQIDIHCHLTLSYSGDFLKRFYSKFRDIVVDITGKPRRLIKVLIGDSNVFSACNGYLTSLVSVLGDPAVVTMVDSSVLLEATYLSIPLES
ncbi:hypothetical protein BpHYR1_040598 [Brachionus plicatilis]|uniref:Uncharacterized protein n=1 Tax=Brachionus plicatilis TaxID=10195 RepID=A0A3M7RI34_BRAPC|nr:hypothetical protein BpHYR1_040598 [Brachionus plicatilis]